MNHRDDCGGGRVKWIAKATSSATISPFLQSNPLTSRTWTFGDEESSCVVRVRVERLFEMNSIFNLVSSFNQLVNLVKLYYHLCSCQLRHICGDGKRGIGCDESCQPNMHPHFWPCKHTGDSDEWNAIMSNERRRKQSTNLVPKRSHRMGKYTKLGGSK